MKSINKLNVRLIAFLLFMSLFTHIAIYAEAIHYKEIGKLSNWVNAVDIHPSGKTIAIGGEGAIIIYSIENEIFHGRLDRHQSYIQSIVYSTSGDAIYSIGWDGYLRKTFIDANEKFSTAPGYDVKLGIERPIALAISKNNSILATEASNNRIALYNPLNLELLGYFNKIEDKPVEMVFSDIDKFLFVGTNKGQIYIFDVDKKTLLKKWKVHSGSISGIIPMSSGQFVITSGDDKKIKLWDIPKSKMVKQKKLNGAVSAISKSPDGKFLYVAEGPGRLDILDDEFQEVAEPMTHNGKVLCLAMDKSGKYLGAGLNINKLIVWQPHKIKEIRMAYDQPCKLVMQAEFDDNNSIIPNKAIDGGENVIVHAEIVNQGEGVAYGVVLKVTGDNSGIEFNDIYKVGNILPGATENVDITLKASLDIKDGDLNLIFHAEEDRQYDARSGLKLKVYKLPKPEFVFSGLELDDSGRGQTRGNGNGIPENDEIVETEVFVKNTGKGPTKNAELTVSECSMGIIVSKESCVIPYIASGSTGSARLRFEIPRVYGSNDLSVTFQVKDPVTGKSNTISKIWAINKNIPVLTCKIETEESLANGRTSKVKVSLTNSGDLEAENVIVKLSSVGGVEVLASTSEPILRIEPGSRGIAKYFDVRIPVDHMMSKISLQAAISQDNFEGTTLSKDFSVKLRKPDIVFVDLIRQNNVTQGENLELHLALRNNGDYEARKLSVHIDFGRLGKNRIFNIDKIAAGDEVTLDKINLIIPSGIAPGRLDVSIIVRQNYFADMTKIYTYDIEEANVAVTSVKPVNPNLPIGSASISTGSRTRNDKSTIKLFNIPDNNEVLTDRYRIKIVAKSPFGIADVMTIINGETQDRLSERPSDLTILHASDDMDINYDVELKNLKPNSTNTVEIRLRDKRNEFESVTEEIYYRKEELRIAAELDPNIDVNIPPKLKNMNENSVALLIGISKYQKKDIPDVDFAIMDAIAVKQYLIESFGYNQDNIIELYDDQATKTQIEIAVKEMLHAKVEAGVSNLFIYYSGHGGPNIETKQGYLLPFDCDPEPRRIKISGYPLNEFYQDISELKARDVTVVIDACFSGESDGGSVIGDASPAALVISKKGLSQGNGISFTASSGAEIATWYREKKHGLFTYYFLKGLRGEADMDMDKKITGNELQSYIHKNVNKNAASRGRIQNPEMSGNGNRIILDYNN